MNVGTWPAPATAQAHELAANWLVFASTGAAVGGVTALLILYAVFRFRARPLGDEALPQQVRTNNRLEIAWTALPLLIVMLLFVYTYRVEADVEHLDPAPAERIAVDAYRWGWTFMYRDGPRIDGNASDPPEMVLPRGETTQIDVTSVDVTHSFWIPDFLFKRDAIPGQITSFDLTPQRDGVYIGRCAQFCGLQHAVMSFRVRVVDASAYGRWHASALAPHGVSQ